MNTDREDKEPTVFLSEDYIRQLKDFYGCETDIELIYRQNESIKRLQNRLKERPRMFPMPPERFA